MIFGDSGEILRVLVLTLVITGTSTLISVLIGVPAGLALGVLRFPCKKLILSVVNAGMGLPPVVVGLFYTMLFWRSGPLGSLGLLYTPAAMVIGEVTISLPLVVGFMASSLQSSGEDVRVQARALGASWLQEWVAVLREVRLGAMTAIIAGFGSVISEVGAAMMLGGNIKGRTRVLTTAIVLEASRGNFRTAMSLGILLLLLTFAVSSLLTFVQQGKGRTAKS